MLNLNIKMSNLNFLYSTEHVLHEHYVHPEL